MYRFLNLFYLFIFDKYLILSPWQRCPHVRWIRWNPEIVPKRRSERLGWIFLRPSSTTQFLERYYWKESAKVTIWMQIRAHFTISKNYQCSGIFRLRKLWIIIIHNYYEQTSKKWHDSNSKRSRQSIDELRSFNIFVFWKILRISRKQSL